MPIFAVAKTNGGIYLVQVFQALNVNTHTDKYSTKNFSKYITYLRRSGSTILTTLDVLDITARLWQLFLHTQPHPNSYHCLQTGAITVG